MTRILKWLGVLPPSRGEVARIWAKVLLQGFFSLEGEEKEVLYRTSLQVLLPVFLHLAEEDGERVEELLGEAAARLPELWEDPSWRGLLGQALTEGVSPSVVLTLWAKTWGPALGEALARGVPEGEVREIRRLRAAAAKGVPGAAERLREKLFLLEPLRLDWRGDEEEEGGWDIPDPRPYPGAEAE